MSSPSRFAVVTGGTVGIGAACAEALLAAGYRVAVNYARNVQAAQVFTERTGVAGITRDAMLHRMKPEPWREVLANILKSVPLGRLATAAEIARGVVFLADDAAGFITGSTLYINGGKYLG
jgi:acetoacetyl-CoA reductase